MHNFRRVVSLALQQRTTLITALFCSGMVAFLWGANLGLSKPLVEVVFSGKTPHAWIESHITDSQNAITELKTKQHELTLAIQKENSPALKTALGRVEFDLASQEKSHYYLVQLRPYILKYCPNDSFQMLVVLVGILLLATIFKDIFLTWNQILVERISQRTVLQLRKQFFRRTLDLDLAAFGQENTSKLLSRFTNDIGQLNLGLITLLGKFLLEPFKMIACLLGAGFICWRLLLLSMFVTPIAAFVVQRLASSIKRANRKAMEEMSQIYAMLSETFHNVPLVKAYTRERRERQKFHRAAKNYYLKSRKITFYNAMSRPGMEVIGMSIIVMAIVAGGYLVLNHQTHLLGIRMSDRPLDVGSLIAFFALLAGAADPARKMSEVFNNLQSGIAAADRVYECYDREPTIVDPATPQNWNNAWQELTLENISFQYTPGCPVLQNLTLKIRAGESIAIVGPNGCGKSTLANLLLRFYDPNAGSIRFDSHDIASFRLRDLRGAMSFVNQQTQLFDETVYENIRYGNPQATPAEIQHAAESAFAHKFITEKLEEGYQTRVGERGMKLSGGQRQRIALARAILRNPSVMILDEATSQVDVESEQLIHAVLEKLRQERTLIMITHRLTSLDLADRIVVMDHGRIIDQGTYAELLKRCDLFRKLFQIQSRDAA